MSMNYPSKQLKPEELLKDTQKNRRKKRSRHRRTQSYTDYDYKSLQKTEKKEITPDFVLEMINYKKTLDANTTQRTLDRDKKKKGEKIVIVDVLNENHTDPQQRDGFFQFRQGQLDQHQVKTKNVRIDLKNKKNQYDIFDRKYNFTEFFQQNPRIDEKDEEVINNDNDEVPSQVATKTKTQEQQLNKRKLAIVHKKGKNILKSKYKSKIMFQNTKKIRQYNHSRHASVQIYSTNKSAPANCPKFLNKANPFLKHSKVDKNPTPRKKQSKNQPVVIKDQKSQTPISNLSKSKNLKQQKYNTNKTKIKDQNRAVIKRFEKDIDQLKQKTEILEQQNFKLNHKIQKLLYEKNKQDQKNNEYFARIEQLEKILHETRINGKKKRSKQPYTPPEDRF